ncbi:2 iron 2 sulfur cluster binding protein [Rutstroemia sp. NJR-2017a BBW]|nr:2 iron 2 sulfur cluster binding protein [Rutstroemia sp. NJR-2017a BBW]
MHLSALTLTLLLSSSSALQIPSLFSPPEPFYAPFHLDLDSSTTDNSTLLPEENTSPARNNEHPDLVKRATTTTLTRNSCPTSYSPCATHAAACCPTSAICSTDSRHNIACCAIGASCTGTVATPTRTTAATQTAQFVSNPYFPFPVLPTSYSNSAACASATDGCAKNYALCTVDLEGGMGGGVTVSAPNGGITVAASTPSGGRSERGEHLPESE